MSQSKKANGTLECITKRSYGFLPIPTGQGSSGYSQALSGGTQQGGGTQDKGQWAQTGTQNI